MSEKIAHDSEMLAIDGQLFIDLFRLLGMDVSGSDTTEIYGAVKKIKEENAALKEALQAASELSAAAMRYAEGAMK